MDDQVIPFRVVLTLFLLFLSGWCTRDDIRNLQKKSTQLVISARSANLDPIEPNLAPHQIARPLRGSERIIEDQSQFHSKSLRGSSDNVGDKESSKNLHDVVLSFFSGLAYAYHSLMKGVVKHPIPRSRTAVSRSSDGYTLRLCGRKHAEIDAVPSNVNPKTGEKGDKRQYYNVMFPPPCISGSHLVWDRDTVLHDIVEHWKQTAPEGVVATPPKENPRIFVHAQSSDPYSEMYRDGYLQDDGPQHQNLWTIPLTETFQDIRETYKGQHWVYVTVLRTQYPLDVNNPDLKHGVKYVHMGTQLGEEHEHDNQPIGRIWSSKSGDATDAVVWTHEGQQAHPLDIVRVYVLHWVVFNKDQAEGYDYDQEIQSKGDD